MADGSGLAPARLSESVRLASAARIFYPQPSPSARRFPGCNQSPGWINGPRPGRPRCPGNKNDRRPDDAFPANRPVPAKSSLWRRFGPAPLPRSRAGQRKWRNATRRRQDGAGSLKRSTKRKKRRGAVRGGVWSGARSGAGVKLFLMEAPGRQIPGDGGPSPALLEDPGKFCRKFWGGLAILNECGRAQPFAACGLGPCPEAVLAVAPSSLSTIRHRENHLAQVVQETFNPVTQQKVFMAFFLCMGMLKQPGSDRVRDVLVFLQAPASISMYGRITRATRRRRAMCRI